MLVRLLPQPMRTAARLKAFLIELMLMPFFATLLPPFFVYMLWTTLGGSVYFVGHMLIFVNHYIPTAPSQLIAPIPSRFSGSPLGSLVFYPFSIATLAFSLFVGR